MINVALFGNPNVQLVLFPNEFFISDDILSIPFFFLAIIGTTVTPSSCESLSESIDIHLDSATSNNQYVGNWPGVTIDKKEGFLGNDIKIVDLPGIYAMDTFSNEEKVSKEFLENGDVDVIEYIF